MTMSKSMERTRTGGCSRATGVHRNCMSHGLSTNSLRDSLAATAAARRPYAATSTCSGVIRDQYEMFRVHTYMLHTSSRHFQTTCNRKFYLHVQRVLYYRRQASPGIFMATVLFSQTFYESLL